MARTTSSREAIWPGVTPACAVSRLRRVRGGRVYPLGSRGRLGQTRRQVGVQRLLDGGQETGQGVQTRHLIRADAFAECVEDGLSSPQRAPRSGFGLFELVDVAVLEGAIDRRRVQRLAVGRGARPALGDLDVPIGDGAEHPGAHQWRAAQGIQQVLAVAQVEHAIDTGGGVVVVLRVELGGGAPASIDPSAHEPGRVRHSGP